MGRVTIDVIARDLRGPIGDNSRLRITASDVGHSRTAATNSTLIGSLYARSPSRGTITPRRRTNVVLRFGANSHGCRIIARIARRSHVERDLAVGETIIAQVKGVALLAPRSGSGVHFTTKGEPT